MSDGATLDGTWVASVASARGLHLSRERAQEIAAQVAPTLRQFRAMTDELSPDDDMYEFRRLLFRETTA
jgi:hypothetical protein